jgi:hypothetical protein
MFVPSLLLEFICGRGEAACIWLQKMSEEICFTHSCFTRKGKRSMRHTRVIVTHYGGPDARQMVEDECPEPKDGEVRVRVLAAGVALPDLLMREGVHPETPPLPFTPG